MEVAMVTFPTTTELNPFAQLGQFCTSLKDLVCSVCERTDTAFRRVHVRKTGPDGNIRTYAMHAENGQTLQAQVLSYIEDVKTGEMYLDEPGYVVATKCALIALNMPFYTAGKMAWHLFKTPIEIGAMVIDTIIKVGQQLALQKLHNAAVEMGRGIS